MSRASPAILAFLLLASAGGEAWARVVRFDVKQVRAFAGGHSFGGVGRYERIDGVATMEADPRNPVNTVIVNLDKAPRNARGMVEFTAPFLILKPVMMAAGNGQIFYVIN